MQGKAKQDKKEKLILRIETEKGTAERVIEGAVNIAYILDEAGILDKELEELLEYDCTKETIN